MSASSPSRAPGRNVALCGLVPNVAVFRGWNLRGRAPKGIVPFEGIVRDIPVALRPTGMWEVRPLLRLGLIGAEFEELQPDGTLLARTDVEFVVVDPSDLSGLTVGETVPDLVILDADASVDRTAGTIRDIRSTVSPSTTVILLVVPGLNRDRWSGCGADGVVTRPLTTARLLDALRRHVTLPERDSERGEEVLKVELASGSVEWSGYTRDISVHGAYLHGHVPFSPSEEVALRFHLPGEGDERSLEGSAQIVRLETDAHGAVRGAAIRFQRLRASDRGRLGRWLRDRVRGAS